MVRAYHLIPHPPPNPSRCAPCPPRRGAPWAPTPLAAALRAAAPSRATPRSAASTSSLSDARSTCPVTASTASASSVSRSTAAMPFMKKRKVDATIHGSGGLVGGSAAGNGGSGAGGVGGNIGRTAGGDGGILGTGADWDTNFVRVGAGRDGGLVGSSAGGDGGFVGSSAAMYADADGVEDITARRNDRELEGAEAHHNVVLQLMAVGYSFTEHCTNSSPEAIAALLLGMPGMEDPEPGGLMEARRNSRHALHIAAVVVDGMLLALLCNVLQKEGCHRCPVQLCDENKLAQQSNESVKVGKRTATSEHCCRENYFMLPCFASSSDFRQHCAQVVPFFSDCFPSPEMEGQCSGSSIVIKDSDDGYQFSNSSWMFEEIMGAGQDETVVCLAIEKIHTYIYKMFQLAPIRTLTTWRRKLHEGIYILPAIRLQGPGDCSYNATVTAMESRLKVKFKNFDIRLSVDHLKSMVIAYYISKDGEKLKGSQRLEICLKMAQMHGILSEEDFNAGRTTCTEAKRYRVRSYRELSDAEKKDISRYLDNAEVILTSFRVTEDYRELLPHEIYRYIPVPSNTAELAVAALHSVHCVVLTGHGLGADPPNEHAYGVGFETYYEYLNSYSHRWGLDGFGFIYADSLRRTYRINV